LKKQKIFTRPNELAPATKPTKVPLKNFAFAAVARRRYVQLWENNKTK